MRSALVAPPSLFPRLRLRKELAADARSVKGDRIQVQQVLVNLIRNACDATDGHPEPEIVDLEPARRAGQRHRLRRRQRRRLQPARRRPLLALRVDQEFGASASASPSRARSSRRMAAGSGSRIGRAGARASASPCPRRAGRRTGKAAPPPLETCRLDWRPEPESNRRARICSPLRNHSAIGPPRGEMVGFGLAVNRRRA